MNYFELDALPFFEYRKPVDETLGKRFQLFDKSIRKQVKHLKESSNDVGDIIYMEVDKITNVSGMKEVTYKIVKEKWVREKWLQRTIAIMWLRFIFAQMLRKAKAFIYHTTFYFISFSCYNI